MKPSHQQNTNKESGAKEYQRAEQQYDHATTKNKDKDKRGLHANKKKEMWSSLTTSICGNKTVAKEYQNVPKNASRRWHVRKRNGQKLPQVSQPMEPKLPQDEHLGKQSSRTWDIKQVAQEN